VRGKAARALLPALVVLALVAGVAIAATGSTSVGSADARPPADQVVDTILSLGMVALIPGALLLIYGLTQREAIKREIAAKGYRRSSFLTYVIAISVFTALMSWGLASYRSRGAPADEIGDAAFPRGVPRPGDPSAIPDVAARDPQFAVVPVLIVCALLALAAFAYWYAQGRDTPLFSRRKDAAQDLADALDESLDALRAEPDPRRAVIAAYARLERVLGAHGFPRRADETPEEYLGRILEGLRVQPQSIRRLTDLFTEAKFSRHVVDSAMKEDAIDALSTVRDELRARREAQLEEERRAREPATRVEAGEPGGAQ
jgi:Domain of unknown function (DUF4129)